jgi:hypothetical protein
MFVTRVKKLFHNQNHECFCESLKQNSIAFAKQQNWQNTLEQISGESWFKMKKHFHFSY